jgi:hypothetical protein
MAPNTTRPNIPARTRKNKKTVKLYEKFYFVAVYLI